MRFKTHNQTEVPFAGTHLQGYVDTTYDDLVSLFGEPVRSYPGSKVDWQWAILFDNGVIATVYNWKNGPSYMGPAGKTKDQITEWHIGGLDTKSVSMVLLAMASTLQPDFTPAIIQAQNNRTAQ